MWLKYGDQIRVLPVKPVSPVDGGGHPNLSEAISQYKKALKLREQSFDEARRLQMEKALLLWPCTQLLLPRELKPDEARLQGMRIAIRSYVTSDKNIN